MATSHTSLTPWLWRLHTGLRLVQGVACCPVASSHYLKQCWLIISKVLLHSHRKKYIDYLNVFKNYILKFTQASGLMILVKSDETMNGKSDDERILTIITMFCPGLPNYSTTTHVMKLLTYCCLVVSYGVIDMCQLWLRWWLGASRHQVITWTNVDLSSEVLCGIQMKEISHVLIKIICSMSREVTLKLSRHLSVANQVISPDSKIHGANVGPTWGRQDPGGPMLATCTLLSRSTCKNSSQADGPLRLEFCTWTSR